MEGRGTPSKTGEKRMLCCFLGLIPLAASGFPGLPFHIPDVYTFWSLSSPETSASRPHTLPFQGLHAGNHPSSTAPSLSRSLRKAWWNPHGPVIPTSCLPAQLASYGYRHCLPPAETVANSSLLENTVRLTVASSLTGTLFSK